jgi:hypothetical protein
LTISPKPPQPKIRPIAAVNSSGATKLPVQDISTPVIRGAIAPPILPPKFWIEAQDDTRCGGATSIGIAFADAVVRLSAETASVKAVMAIQACCDSAATTMKMVEAKMPPTAKDRRTVETEAPRATIRSLSQPPSSVKTMPARNGSIAKNPVLMIDMCCWSAR